MPDPEEDTAYSQGPLHPDDLAPVQALLLEVYRTHTKFGYPGSVPGSIAHPPSQCRKCAVLERHRPTFEGLLPWLAVHHLHQVGDRNRPR